MDKKRFKNLVVSVVQARQVNIFVQEGVAPLQYNNQQYCTYAFPVRQKLHYSKMVQMMVQQ